MFTTADIKQSSAKLDEILAKQPRPCNPNENPTAYQHLSVVKKLCKAKFSVYLTCSKLDHQNYAMKIFSRDGGKPNPFFKNEARFAALKHPNIVNIVDQEEEKEILHRGEVKKVSYIVMEYAPYGDLFDFITKHGHQLDDKLVRTLFRQLIDGIEYLQFNGVAHLDLKPENLLLGDNFNLKIADFDLSHVQGDAQVLSKGTRNYRAPELFEIASDQPPKLSLPFAADVYSAGVILFIMKSGGIYPHSEYELFRGVNFAQLMYRNNEEFWKRHCKIQEKNVDFFDKDFRELFNAMVRYNPRDRITITDVKQSKWYNGPVYTPVEFERKMNEILKC